jgi:hypothetical protein
MATTIPMLPGDARWGRKIKEVSAIQTPLAANEISALAVADR